MPVLLYDFIMKVTGLGQCAIDHLFIVDSFPVSDTKKEVQEWTIQGGGPVATALVSLAKLGVSCDYHGIIGDDEAGEKIEAALQEEGINVDGLLRRSDSDSQAAFILVEKENGKRTIFWKRPSAEALNPSELPSDFLEDADFLLLDGLMSETSLYAAKKAAEMNIPVMLDAGRVREGMIELAHMSDHLVCSEEFARGFAGTEDNFDPDKAILKMKVFNAVSVTITLGEHGSITMCNDEIFHTPAFIVDVVDTTGAGDVFHGGYIYGLLQRWEIKEVVRFAAAFAALKCRKLGGRAGIPSLDETMSLLDNKD